MPDRLVLPSATGENLATPSDSNGDMSQLVTTHLRFHQRPAETTADQQIAQHEAEISRLEDLVVTLERTITELMHRLRLTTEPRSYEALKHTCGDLQRFKLEMGALQAEHQRALDRLQAQE